MAARGDLNRVIMLLARATPADNEDIANYREWLDTAHAVVDQRLVGAGLAEPVLTMIEEHLACHYIEMQSSGSSQVTSKRLGSVSVTYAKGADVSTLQATRHGRIAAELDTSGTLTELSKPKPAFAVL